MLELILDKLNNIEQKLEQIENDIKNINYKIDNNLINNCEKMGSHVDFVENVYNTVRSPLQYISNSITMKNSVLPQITSQENQKEE